MMGSRVGPTAGSQVGSSVGSVGDDEGQVSGIPGVSRDATSLIYAPASSAEWTAFMSSIGLATGNPSFLWLCQDASGNLADQIGGTALVPANAPTYSNAVPGWTRVAVGTVDATANQKFQSTAAALPDLSVTAALLLAYVGFASSPAAIRGVLGMGTTMSDARHDTVHPRLVSGANSATGVQTLGTQARPWVNKADVPGGANVLYTDQEKVVPAVGALTGKSIQLGSTGAVPASAFYLYAALFTGAAAQLTDAQVKTLLQGLGWTIPWT